MNSFKKLIIWRDSISLIKTVYKVADSLPKAEEYNLKQQLKRAAVSVALNIAEGKNRRMGREFLHFLSVSSGSISEVEAILAISEELGYVKIESDLWHSIELLGKKINSLRGNLESKCK
ncbi:MAG TPA: four helix bundle protein [Candidatus Goldiibacteriota bacterium]|nr:four helix bundle protein [Candidatus Goldiibacteriota bacterium]